MAGGTQGGRGSGSDGRRPTKAERREEARLKREEIQRRMSRRRRNRSIGLVLVAVAAVVVVVAVFLASGGNGGSTANIASAADLLKQAPAAKQSAGCDPVQTTPNYANAFGADPSIDHEHIGSSPDVATAPALSTYATIPPASGPHDPVPLPAGIYQSAPDVYRTIHSLEHGAVIIWYAPGTTGNELDDLLAFYGQSPSKADIGQAKIIVAPYDYPSQGASGQLPSGVHMAVVAWHRLELCSAVNLAAAFDFSSQFEVPGFAGQTYTGVAREPTVPI